MARTLKPETFKLVVPTGSPAYNMSSPSSSSTPAHAKKNLVAPLLEQLYPTPVSFFSQSNATSNDVVPLCLHCLMVEAGCTPLSSRNNRPPSNWNKHEDEWVVEYGHGVEINGALAKTVFRLHCSLQRRSGRLFVHAEEIGDNVYSGRGNDSRQDAGTGNIQVLGLQLANYTQGIAENDQGGSWNSYIRNERTLKEMFRQFIVKPLLETSGRRALEGLREEGRGKELYQEALDEKPAQGRDEDEPRDKQELRAETKKECANESGDTSKTTRSAHADLGERPTNQKKDARDDDCGRHPVQPNAEQHNPEQNNPELFTPEPGYAYSSYIESYGSSVYLGVAAAIGVACVVGWWTLRTRKAYA